MLQDDGTPCNRHKIAKDGIAKQKWYIRMTITIPRYQFNVEYIVDAEV